jgi:hypothetical protein
VRPDQASETAAVLSFVHGRTPWSALEPLGVRVHVDEAGASLRAGQDLAVVKVSVEDVETGYRATSQDGPDALRTWALIMLMATFIDLDELGRSEAGESVLEMLWRASDRTTD